MSDELSDRVSRALDALSFKRAVNHYDDACEMADTLTSFGIESVGTPIEVIDGDKKVLTYGVLITEESFPALKELLRTQLKGFRHDSDSDPEVLGS